eukprot:TRINITY_DN13443_c1_g2_i1.p1 TRINITY_DN13443_c1_g2~~TRINITY_DN13443_c1_g2_i1.p1  ORF type:complete len:223 (+),score=48.27 TRINITY_DN13443_c1_g2_i1:63-671(+)
MAAVLTSASNATLNWRCGAGILHVMVSLRQASVSKVLAPTLFGDIAAGLRQVWKNKTAAALGDVLSVTVDWVAHLQCHIDHAENVTLDYDDRCAATSCQQGYAVSADATRCDQVVLEDPGRPDLSWLISFCISIAVALHIGLGVLVCVYFFCGRCLLQCAGEEVGQECSVEKAGADEEVGVPGNTGCIQRKARESVSSSSGA